MRGTENPWDRIIGNLGIGGRRHRPLMDKAAWSAPALLFLGWGAVGVARSMDAALAAGRASVVVLVSLAFLAPSLGAQARRCYDRSPLLAESLVTPMDGTHAADAIHRAIRRLALLAFLLGVATGAGFLLAQSFFPPGELAGVLREDPVTFLLAGLHGLFLFGEAPPPDIVGAGVFFLLAAGAYAAGVHMNASILAMSCQLAPWNRLVGGVVTAALILLLVGQILLSRWLLLAPRDPAWGELAMMALSLVVLRGVVGLVVWNTAGTRLAAGTLRHLSGGGED